MRFHKKGGYLARRTSTEKEEEAEAIKNWNPRYRKNVIIYLWYFRRCNWDY